MGYSYPGGSAGGRKESSTLERLGEIFDGEKQSRGP